MKNEKEINIDFFLFEMQLNQTKLQKPPTIWFGSIQFNLPKTLNSFMKIVNSSCFDKPYNQTHNSNLKYSPYCISISQHIHFFQILGLDLSLNSKLQIQD